MIDEPTPDEIIEALRASGWLLEQDTADRLREHDFITGMGRAFEDPDEPEKSREIDVFGFRELFRDEDVRLSLTARVIAECKHSAGPYVFVGRPLEDFERAHQPTEHVLRFRSIREVGPDLGGGRRQIRELPAWQWLGLHELPGSPSLDDFRATQMTRLDRQKTWKADNRGIFTSLVHPLAKALRALQAGVPGGGQYDAHNRQHGWAAVALFFPIVVTTAPLFVVDAASSPLEPRKRPWVTMTREIKSRSVTGQFNVDVVNYDNMADYLTDRVLCFSSGVAHLMSSDPERFVTKDI